jgi:hypothetical protein
MTIQQMEYELKLRLNKVDSEQYTNLLIPQLDLVLNEALMLFIKLQAQPYTLSPFGFEKSQRSIDNIRPLVVNAEKLTSVEDDIYTLPANYLHYISSKIKMKKGICEDYSRTVKVIQHDDEDENSPFDRSSFSWRHINIRFFNKGIKVFIHNFLVNEFLLDYIKQPLFIHNARGFSETEGYKLPGNDIALKGTQDCELAADTHYEILDLATLIATKNIQIPDYQTKLHKIQLNNS